MRDELVAHLFVALVGDGLGARRRDRRGAAGELHVLTGVTVATAKKLVESGQLDPDAETVLLITGDGLKTLDALGDRVGPKATVQPSVEAVQSALDA